MARRVPEEERRRVFRRMELVYVWGPPALIVMLCVAAGAVLALFIPLLPGRGYAVRWLASAGFLLIIALVMLAVRLWLDRRA